MRASYGTCSRHPDEPVSYECRDCQSRRCSHGIEETPLTLRTARICTDCGGRCYSLEAREEDVRKRSFLPQFWRALGYPLAPRRRVGLVVAGAWFGIIIPATIGVYLHILTLPFAAAIFQFLFLTVLTVIFLLTIGYVTAYLRHAVNYSATFHERPPGWSGFRDPLRSILPALLFFLNENVIKR